MRGTQRFDKIVGNNFEQRGGVGPQGESQDETSVSAAGSGRTQ